jgi:hypothetical protein
VDRRAKAGPGPSTFRYLPDPFSLLWGGFALFWNVGVWVAGAPFFFRLFGLPFLVAGIYITVGRFFHDASMRRKLNYAVTNRRVLILKRSRSPKLTSLDLDRLPGLEMTEHRDGTGTIIFDSDSSLFSLARRGAGMGLWIPSLGPPQFFRIDQSQRIYRLIRDN